MLILFTQNLLYQAILPILSGSLTEVLFEVVVECGGVAEAASYANVIEVHVGIS